jgi:glutathione peroxidase
MNKPGKKPTTANAPLSTRRTALARESDRSFATRLARYCARNPVALEPLTHRPTGRERQWMRRDDVSGLLGATSIKWNFTKLLSGRDGQVMKRFDPTTAPSDMTPAIERALAPTSVP